MGVIENAAHKAFHELPVLALRKLLRRKTKEAGITMSAKEIEAFANHILSGAAENFSWRQRGRGNPTLHISFNEEDLLELDATIANAKVALPRLIDEASDEISLTYFHGLCERWPSEFSVQQTEVSHFRENLEARWGEGINYLRMLLTCCREIGRGIFSRHKRSKSQRYKHRRWVMVRLHARACQVTDEVICLMENGFADGALARWRTLHELSIVAKLISGGDELLAERYILHDAVEVKRQADDYDLTQMPLGYKPIGKRARTSIERRYKNVIDKFGPTFASPYGWAAEALKLKKPTFKDLQSAAGHESLNSYYKMASFNVHASARSLFFNLASIAEIRPMAGRSNAGLVEPGARAAQTLALITALYFDIDHDLDRIAELKCLLHVRDAVAPSLQVAETILDHDEAARQAGLAKRRASRNATKKR